MACGLTLGNLGQYSVVVHNAYGSTESEAAQLVVLEQTSRIPTSTETGLPTIPTDNHLKVFSGGSFQAGILPNLDRMTVVLTHGWKSNPGEWAAEMAEHILARATVVPPPNIIAWDWSGEAQRTLPVASRDTAFQGRALGKALFTALGPNYSQPIHFIGHSLGTLVNARAADYLHGDASGAKPLKSPGAFIRENTHVTLMDEAELVSESFNAVLTVLASMAAQKPVVVRVFNDNPLPIRFARVDNYISAVGLPHTEAANVILTNGLFLKAPDFQTLQNAATAFHGYPHQWYAASTSSPADDVMGFRWSFERGSLAGMPAARSMYLQSFNSSHQDLRSTEFYEGVTLLRQRFLKYAAALGYTVVHEVKDAVVEVAGEVSAQFEQASKDDPYALATGPAYAWDMIVKLRTTANNPAPRGEVQAASGDNVPAYAWIPVTVPSNSTTMSFDFMLEGDGQEDAFAVAVNGTNVLALETSLIETNVTMNSGMIDVTAWAGQDLELFFGIVGGTSSNATITVSGIRFYSVLPPALAARAFGNDLVIAWPISADGYALESSTNAVVGAWESVTNAPVIVDLENTVTNQISGGSRFYRLRK